MENLIQSSHEALTTVAQQQGCPRSTLVGSVSRHELPSTASFANLAALHNTVKHQSSTVAQRAYVATSGDALVFSSKIDAVRASAASTAPAAPAAPAAPEAPTSGSGAGATGRAKRKRELLREDQAEQVSQARKRLSAVSSDAHPIEEFDLAQKVINQLVAGLRGPAGEIAVQSYSMLTRKLKPTDQRASVVIALRISAGIPILVAQLKRCLGPCWIDGVVSSESSVNGVCDRDLPLTEEGTASMEMGNRPMLIVTSVPRAPPPPPPPEAR